MQRILRFFWPGIVDRASAGRAIKMAYYGASVLSVVFFFTAFLAMYAVPSVGGDHRLDFVDAAAFMIFGWLLKNEDPFSAVFAFAMCLIEAWVRFSPLTWPAWIILVVLFVNGIRGSFWCLRNDPQVTAGLPESAVEEPAARAKFFSIAGRLNQVWYLVYFAILATVSVLLFYTSWYLVNAAEIAGTRKFIIVIMCMLPSLLLAFALTIQRCHDFNRSGWRAIFLLVPFGFLAFLAVPSAPFKNEYGHPIR